LKEKSGTFSSDKRFWSAAALPTDSHMEVLNELKRILG
jgi:hypothetical protein